MTEPFSNREIKQIHDSLYQKMEDIHNEGREERGKIWEQVKYTNGKLKKVVIALILVVGFIFGTLGQGLLPLLLSLIV